LAADLRKRRHFREYPKSPARDPGGWLGSEDSNRHVSKSNRSLQDVAADRIVGARKPDLRGLAITSAAAAALEAIFRLGFDADRTMIDSV
jgi:hypothetical protein